MLKLPTPSGCHDLFLKSAIRSKWDYVSNIFHRYKNVYNTQFMLPMEKSVTFIGACADEITPNG
jgi:hypothetical protein